MAVRAKWYQVSCRIVWSGLTGKRQWLQVMHFNDSPGIAIELARTKTADLAGSPVDTQAEQTIAWVPFASAYDGEFDGAFSQRFLIGRGAFLDRVVSIKFCHCGKNRDNELTAGLRNGIIVKPALNATLLCDDRETAIVDHPVIDSLTVTDFQIRARRY